MEFRIEERVNGNVFLALHYWSGYYSISLVLKNKIIILDSNKGTVWDARSSFENLLEEFGIQRKYSDEEIIAKLSE